MSLFTNICSYSFSISTTTNTSSKVINCVNIQSSIRVCAVCGDIAVCQHYGVRTCEGCKGFFKRTVQKNSKYVCLAHQSCPVDRRRRNRCQFCRFQKCLVVGMVKEVVRTDSLKGRRGRLPAKQQNNEVFGHPKYIFSITELVKAHEDTSPVISSLDYTAYIEPMFNSSPLIVSESENVRQFYRILKNSVNVIEQFTHRIPGFTDLCGLDQALLFQTASLEMFVLRLAYRIRPNDSKLIFCNGMVLHKAQCERVFGDWLVNILEFSNYLNNLGIDASCFACISALAVITVVLESDGTEICAEKVLEHCLKENTTFMVIGNEKWCQQAQINTSTAVPLEIIEFLQTTAESSDRALLLLTPIQSNEVYLMAVQLLTDESMSSSDAISSCSQTPEPPKELFEKDIINFLNTKKKLGKCLNAMAID